MNEEKKESKEEIKDLRDEGKDSSEELDFISFYSQAMKTRYDFSVKELESLAVTAEKFCEQLDSQGYDIFIHTTAFGETCHFCFLFDAYKKKSRRKIAVLAEKSRLEIIEQAPGVDFTYEMSFNELIAFYMHPVQKRIRKYHVMYTIEMYQLSYPMHPHGMRQQVCAFLGLPFEEPFVKYVLKCERKEQIRKKYEEMGLTKGKAIYVIPEANTYPGEFVSKDFWRRVEEEVQKYGYKIVFNSPSEVLEGVPNIFLGTIDTLEFMKLCGQVVGIRTGFLDVVSAFSRIPVIALYPPHHSKIWKGKFPEAEGEVLQNKIDEKYQAHGLKHLFGNTKAVDVFFEQEEEVLQMIIERFCLNHRS